MTSTVDERRRGRSDDRSEIAALLERVEKAMGPDRELDADILMWGHPELRSLPRAEAGGWLDPTYGRIAPAQPFTASVDSALELVGWLLPGWTWRFGNMAYVGDEPGCLPFTAELIGGSRGYATWNARGHTAPLAILAALLKALQSQPSPAKGE